MDITFTGVIEEVNQRYPSRCVFQVFGQERLQQLAIGQGEMITAHLGINANKSQDGRWFNKLDCWKVDRFGGQQQPQQQPDYGQGTQYQPQPSVFDQGNNMNGGFGAGTEQKNPPF